MSFLLFVPCCPSLSQKPIVMVSPYGKDIVKTVFDRSDEAHEGIDFDAVPFVFLSDGFQKFWPTRMASAEKASEVAKETFLEALKTIQTMATQFDIKDRKIKNDVITFIGNSHIIYTEVSTGRPAVAELGDLGDESVVVLKTEEEDEQCPEHGEVIGTIVTVEPVEAEKSPDARPVFKCKVRGCRALFKSARTRDEHMAMSHPTAV